MRPTAHDYSQRPLLLFWEITKACPLACAHCRAHAQNTAAPGELSHEQALELVRDIGRFGSPSPILVVTGGDPLSRPDVLDILGAANAQGTKVALAPAVSSKLSGSTLDRLHDVGVRAISISLDGATSPTHDAIRNVPGHFERTLESIEELVEHGFTVQVNTTVMERNAEELADVAVLLARLGVHIWEVFFLVHVGRGTAVAELPAVECEDVAHFLYDSASYGFIVRTVEAPFFRRVVNARLDAPADVSPTTHFGLGPLYRRLSARLRAELGPPTTKPKATSAGTRDGNGILFISHDGDVSPAGFLPVHLGNVRDESIVDLYQKHPLLLSIRRAELHGRCGACEHRQLCGGSRSRAYAAFGDPLGEDPACPYIPPGFATALS